MESPMVELMSALASLFESGKYSDLTITCGSKRYPVHRALLATRSSFFDGACRNPFRESETGIIDLTEDDPEAVEHMVNYFYHLDYLTSKPLSRRSSLRSNRSSRSSTVTSPPPPSARRQVPRRRKFTLSMIEDPLLATMGSAVPTTVTTSDPLTPPADDQPDSDFFDGESKRPDSPMADQFTEDPFHAVPMEPQVDTEQKPHLITHAKVYAIAEKYGVAGLKTLAQNKFAQQMELHLDSDELPEACQEAYESTVDTDRGLRNIVIQTFRSHPELSLRKDVEMALRDTPGLAFELFRMASGLPVTSLA
ncbi:hypothetical protein DM02DRAFT_537435 [Periconia macrospinosa]|uniref:BTB domain-containing protein n=1 Tax=Periconia macrospinosa TaxID=97972 RepID=A0A2V1DBD7_9PLEO|nr:hypothetical protein DM02DRAFT_537435 [Periconia macrospinosa]